MFNPEFRKFRRNKIKASNSKVNNKITNFFPLQEACTEEENEDDERCDTDAKRRKTECTASSSSTKERLQQFARKRQVDTLSSHSSKTLKKTNQQNQEGSSHEQNTKLTPFEQQVMELKRKHQGMILMIQSGYKYFFYGEDAEIASKVLNIAMFPNHNFMRCSVPVERLPVHANKLIYAGYKVGVIQQQEVAELKALTDNKSKIFDRELTAVYTKATAIGEEIDPLKGSVNKDTEEASANFILSVAEIQGSPSKTTHGIVAFDVGTGETYFDEFIDNANREELEKRVEHLNPAEVIVSEKLSSLSLTVLKHSNRRVEVISEEKFNFSSGLLEVATFLSSARGPTETITNLPAPVVCALAAMLNYLKAFKLSETLKPENLQSFTSSELYMQLDGTTMRNLEIFKSSNNTHEGSLLSLFDQHSRPHFGARVLREWLSRPLRDIETLRQRQDAVAELLECPVKSVVELHSVLQKIPDLERGLTAVLLRRSTPSSLLVILQNLKCLKTRLEAIIGASDICIHSPLLNKLITESASLLTNVPQFLENMNEDAARKGDVTQFLHDYSPYPSVIELQKQMKNISDQLDALLPTIAHQLGIRSSKYICVHGEDYLIEVKLKQTVPLNWLKVSETKQVTRYRPPEVIKLRHELCVLKAHLKQECQNSWKEFIDSFNIHYSDNKKAVRNIAILDALIALSQLARSDGYCRPELIEDDALISIHRGKHPIVSKLVDNFVPNDAHLENPEYLCMVLSGPNMGGKSCYIRQIALIAIMAHIGSYVPAESATVGMLDAVYTRIGARDEIFERRSTLMLEMGEAASILHKATRRSLVLMDELGRGTSTHDGTAIAVATLSYLINEVQCLTLFVSHFPAVMDVAPSFNFHMGFMVSKLGDDSASEQVTFLYLVSAGKASHSYSLNVSRLAGIPQNIIEKASQKAQNLRSTDEATRYLAQTFLNLWKAESPETVIRALQCESASK